MTESMGNTSPYKTIFGKLSRDPSFNSRMVDQYLDMKRSYSQELRIIKQLVTTLSPTPGYRIYAGGKKTPDLYIFHSSVKNSMLDALEFMREIEGKFTVDKTGRIIFAINDVLIPDVREYTPVLNSKTAHRLSEDDPACKLWQITDRLIKEAVKKKADPIFHKLLLKEGFGEKLETLLV